MSASTKSTPTSSPLRLLILSPITSANAPSPVGPLLEALTGSAPGPEQISAGFEGYTTHAPLVLTTKYYNASIGIWCDEIGAEWKKTMTDSIEEAREVRSAIGAVYVVLNTKNVSSKDELTKALDIVEQVEETRGMCEDEAGGREVMGCVVLVGDGADERVDQMEEGLRSERGVFGWNVVGWDGHQVDAEDGEEYAGTAKNEYGEKVNVARVKEILETVPWTTSSTSTDSAEADFLDEPDWTTSEQRELDREMMGLKMDLHEEEEPDEDEAFGEDEWPELQGGSEDVKVEQLQGLMERLIATREAASEMGDGERQSFARKEVERIMREMG